MNQFNILQSMDTLRFPIGQYVPPEIITPEILIEWRTTIESLPARMRAAVNGLNDEQLNTCYRAEGWTLRQVVHHVADSHMNAYIRFKLALTEDHPTIKPYLEERWAELPDGKFEKVEISLDILVALHRRWNIVLKNIKTDEWKKSVFHPQSNRTMTLEYLLGLYAWHSQHHLAHITNHRKSQGW